MLASLQPAHTPAAPGWWPPAPGYWLLAAIVTAIAVGLALRIRRRGKCLYELADSELQSIARHHEVSADDAAMTAALSRWLRKLALHAFADAAPAAITGDKWLKLLDRGTTDRAFSNGAGRVFAHDVYRAETGVDAQQLLALCRRWLEGIKPALDRADAASKRSPARVMRSQG